MKIEEILNLELRWKPFESSKSDYYTIDFDRDICYLRMNNFPEEPLWTLFYKDQSIDFDDEPTNWKIDHEI